MKLVLCVAAALVVSSASLAQEKGPIMLVRPAGAQPASKPAAKPAHTPIYDEAADARAVIAAAVAAAKKENRRVLIQWGANWCGWCTILHDTLKKDRGLAHEIQYEYDLVHVDVGQFDRNMDLAALYGAELKGNGIPYLTVLDGGGKVLANQPTGPLERPVTPPTEPGGTIDAGYQLDKVGEFLKKFEAKPWQAEEVLQRGLSEAGAQHKAVFLHFGAPWCGWCHKLEDWMARPEVAALLDKAFVGVKIDVDRMPGGPEVLAKYNTKAAGGIPWFVFLSPDGKPIADSTAPEGNTGFPYQDEEIAYFGTMLKKANLPEADIDALIASLRSGRETK